ncbi:MAG: FG-GAP-like repeat-containing protein [Pirellulales bacterium]
MEYQFVKRVYGCVLLTLLMVQLGCNKSDVESTGNPQAIDGHARMVKLLEEVADQAETDNEYVQLKEIEDLRYQLSNAPAAGMLEEKFSLNWRLGPLYLNLGKNDEAIQHLEEVYKMTPQVAENLTEEQINTILMDLAVAQLRKGEAQNCIHCQTGESCILPIRGAGVHSKESGSRESIRYLNMLLERDPKNLTAAWLLNVTHMTLGEHDKLKASEYYISSEKIAQGSDFPEFQDISRDAGIAEISCAGGVSADDFDNDGDIDLIVSNWDVRGQLKIFLNNGDGTFTDFTTESGVTGITGGLNLIHADYDNDGDLDLFVLRGAWMDKLGKYPNSLLQNDGSAKFRDVTFESGLGDEHFPTQTASFADYDNDGDLDLYIGNENRTSNLFQNDGKGHFKDVAKQAGVNVTTFAKGVVWGDYDDDRWPDLYISNGTGPNIMFHNNGDGTFEDVSKKMRVTRPHESFPVWFWDYNNDGHLDLYASCYKVGVRYVAAEFFGHDLPDDHYPCIYQGDGQGGFVEKSTELGLDTVAQPMGANYGDLDNDGFPDFYLGTGYTEYYALMPNRLFHNVGGTKFEDVTISGRVGHLQKGHGVAFADFDTDGDQDLFIETGGAFRGDAFRNVLFENPGFNKNFVQLKLEGGQSNKSAIGARIRVDIIENGEKRSIYRRVGTGGSFGANPLTQHIGIGTATKIEKVEVYWPTSDTTQQFEAIEPSAIYLIREGVDAVQKINSRQNLTQDVQGN